MDLGALVGQGVGAPLVAAANGHEVEGGHGRGISEHGDDEATGIVLPRSIHVLDLHVEPDFIGDGVVTAISHAQ